MEREKMSCMSPKERVLCSLNWQEPDRVPIQVYLTPEMRAKLEVHFRGADVLEALGVDFRSVMPVYQGPIRPTQHGRWYDLWGTGYERVDHGRGGAYDEAMEQPLASLKSMDDVVRYPWPDPDAFDYDALEAQCEQFQDFAVVLGSAGMPDILNGISRGRGMEQVMLDIASRDEVGLAIIDRRVDFFLTVLRNCLERVAEHIDILYVGEDCGHQGGRMFSPRDFDEVFRPRLQKYYDLAHEFGLKVMMHSCGDTHELQTTFIEMGLDVLDSMQPEPPGMDVEAMRDACRGKLAFCGLISTQQTLPFGSVEQCRKEARHRLDVIAPGGGYIFCSSHCIQADTPVENVLAAYGEALGKRAL
jgi:uroporphyrinogen decarboxylase